jgi:hypothetical protein
LKITRTYLGIVFKGDYFGMAIDLNIKRKNCGFVCLMEWLENCWGRYNHLESVQKVRFSTVIASVSEAIYFETL